MKKKVPDNGSRLPANENRLSINPMIRLITPWTVSAWFFNILFANGELEPMVVVEKRELQPLSEASPWVSRISGEDLEQRQVYLLADALRSVPGMLIVRSGQAGAQTSLYSRGSQSDHTVFLLEGRKLSGGFSGLYNLGQLSVAGYSSTEVMRGPSTLQYGGEGIGAAVSLRSSNFQDQQTAGRTITLEGGSFETGRASLNQQIRGKNWRLGWSGNIFTTENDLANAGYYTNGGTVSFQKNITDGLSVDFVSTGFKSDLDLPGAEYNPSSSDYQNSYNYLISPGIMLSDDLWEIKAHYAYGADWVDSYTAGSWGTYQTVGKSEQHQTEILHRINLSEYFKWRGGVAYLSEKFEMKKDAVIDQKRTTKSIHGSIDWVPNDWIEWTAGMRLEEHSFFDNSPVMTSLSLKWHANERVTFYGRWSNGFSPPTGNDLYFPGSGNPDLKPEEMETKEFGASFSGEESSYLGKITFFESDIEQLIEFGVPNTNVGKVNIKGMEVSAEAKISASIKGFLSWTILEAENFTTGENFLDRRAENSGTIGMEWSEEGSKIGISSTLRKNLMEKDFSSWPAVWISGDDYWLTRIYASKKFGNNIRLFGRVENLFDKDYEEVHAYPALGRAVFGGINYSF